MSILIYAFNQTDIPLTHSYHYARTHYQVNKIMHNFKKTRPSLPSFRWPTQFGFDMTDNAGPKHMTVLAWLKPHGYPTLLPGYRSQNFTGPFAYRSKRVSLDSTRLNPQKYPRPYTRLRLHNSVPQSPRE